MAPKSGMTFASAGALPYEDFKLYPGGRGIAQNILSTIEFGFSPFVPFSQDFEMEHAKIGSNGFGVHVSSPLPETEDWARRIADYGGPSKVIEDVAQAPSGDMQAAAEDISHWISIMLEQEGIAKSFDGSVIGELEEQALGMMGAKFDGWKDPRVNMNVEKITGKVEKLGGQTFDMYAKTEPMARALELNLHMISRKLQGYGKIEGPAFIKGVKAIETTNMTKKKYFQRIMLENRSKKVNWAKDWDTGVRKAVKNLLDGFEFSKMSFRAVYQKMVDDAKDEKTEKGAETLDYFGKQILSRFAAMETNPEAFGSAYIFQAPVDRWSSGYARLEPVIEDGYLSNILVETAIIGGENFQKMVGAFGGTKGGVFKEKGTRSLYGTHAQLLLWDAQERAVKQGADAIANVNAIYQDVANELALRSGRGETMGSALRTEMEVGIGNSLMQSPVVDAAEVIGTAAATQLVQKQIEAFFADDGTKTQIEKVYKKAMAGSESVTDSWKKKIPDAQNRTVGAGSIYANSAGLFTDDTHLAGIGIPFWFLIGRDPTGFEKFKKTETHSAEKFKAENLMKRGKKLEPEERGVSMLSGERRAVKDPRLYYISETWKKAYMKGTKAPASEKHAEVTGWRREGEFADIGFGEGAIQDIFGKSRVGNYSGVMRRDGMPDMRRTVNQ